jgi:hypothetical protein
MVFWLSIEDEGFSMSMRERERERERVEEMCKKEKWRGVWSGEKCKPFFQK